MHYAARIVLVVLAGAVTRAAVAQEAPVSPEPKAPPGTILAPKNALELQFELGYTQPLGPLSQDIRMSDVAHAGFVGGGALAWRLSPRFAVAGYGSFHQSAPDISLESGTQSGMVYGGAGGLAANFHFLPYRLVDPYVTAGAGYRLLFVAPGGPADNHMFHGFEALKTDAGVDFRLTKDFALGPMIGADLNVFVWDLDITKGTNGVIPQKSVSTFFFAGVSGKFDVLGKRVAAPSAAPPVSVGNLPRQEVHEQETRSFW